MNYIDPSDPDMRAQSDGYRAAIAGKNADKNPHQSGRLSTCWKAGWDLGEFHRTAYDVIGYVS